MKIRSKHVYNNLKSALKNSNGAEYYRRITCESQPDSDDRDLYKDYSYHINEVSKYEDVNTFFDRVRNLIMFRA
jgi:hypothetical protein